MLYIYFVLGDLPHLCLAQIFESLNTEDLYIVRDVNETFKEHSEYAMERRDAYMEMHGYNFVPLRNCSSYGG